MRGALPALLCLAALVAAPGCDSDSSRADLQRSVADATVHRARFERFERWSHRTLDRRVVQVDAALRETLFAPLKLESEVLDAWVQVDGPTEMELSLRDAPGRPSGVPWRALRDFDGLEVARSLRPQRYPPGKKERVDVVMLRRTQPLGALGTLTLTMALRLEDEAGTAPPTP